LKGKVVGSLEIICAEQMRILRKCGRLCMERLSGSLRHAALPR